MSRTSLTLFIDSMWSRRKVIPWYSYRYVLDILLAIITFVIAFPPWQFNCTWFMNHHKFTFTMHLDHVLLEYVTTESANCFVFWYLSISCPKSAQKIYIDMNKIWKHTHLNSLYQPETFTYHINLSRKHTHLNSLYKNATLTW